MTMTLSDCIERINQALDYPAVEYADISHYFDQAISELNSTLRIGIKPISYILKNYTSDVKPENTVMISSSELSNIQSFQNADAIDGTYTKSYYYDIDKRQFGIKNSAGKYVYYNDIYGCVVYADSPKVDTYRAVVLTATTVYWAAYNTDSLNTLDLTEWLPVDVIILFLIPYVCNKFSIRDGGIGNVFREEFTQGFQQIQTSYDIPNYVNLVSVAGKKAYTEDVNANLENLNINVPTRAIYDSMKIGNAIHPTYGGFYEGGGWGF